MIDIQMCCNIISNKIYEQCLISQRLPHTPYGWCMIVHWLYVFLIFHMHNVCSFRWVKRWEFCSVNTDLSDENPSSFAPSLTTVNRWLSQLDGINFGSFNSLLWDYGMNWFSWDAMCLERLPFLRKRFVTQRT